MNFYRGAAVFSPVRRRRARQQGPDSACALNKTDLVPVNGSSARVSPNRLSYRCPTTIFRDPRNRHRHQSG
jgi:hypothetical protein